MPRFHTAEVIRELVEALTEMYPSSGIRHPAVVAGLDWLRKHEQAGVTKLPGWVKTKRCYNCDQPIFFAAGARRVDPPGWAWVPMCPHPIYSEDSVLDARGVNFDKGIDGSPRLKDPTPGIQWMPHSVLCGRRDRPVDEELGAIWDLTMGEELSEEEKAVSNLLKVFEDTQ